MQWQSTGTGVCKSLQSIGNRLHTGTDMCVESTACSGKVQVQVCVNLYSLYTGTEMCVESTACSGKVQERVCVNSSQPVGDTGYIQVLIYV